MYTTSDEIVKLLESFNTGIKKEMEIGTAYYKSENVAISKREMSFYSITHQRLLEDYSKANNKLKSGYTKIIVDQKLGYLINKDTTITVDSEDIANTLDISKYKKATKKVAKNASNEFYGVLQWYIDKDKQLRFKVIPSQQVMIKMDEDDEDRIATVIRQFWVGKYHFAEVYDDKYIYTWMKHKNDKNYSLMEKTSNLMMRTMVNDTVIGEQEESWGRPPFSILFNNDEHTNDLNMFKAYVDLYDIVSSDFGNNLEDYQEMYWVLKNYSGTNAAEFMEEFKKSRILKVGDGGDAKQVAQEVPYAARIALMNALTNDIFTFGMAVDVKDVAGKTTNVTIKALFANLDLKANDFELEIEDYFQQCVYFINRYRQVIGKQPIEPKLTLTRARILNASEAIDDVLKQRGFRADKMLLKLLPGVTDVDAEIEALKEQQKEEADSLGNDMGFEDGE